MCPDRNTNPFATVAKAFTVFGIGKRIPFQAAVTMSASKVYEYFESGMDFNPYEYPICLVIDGDKTIGYIDFELPDFPQGVDVEKGTAGDICQIIRPDMVVPSGTNLLDVLPLLKDRFQLMFISDVNQITHFFFAHFVDSLALRVSLFSLITSIENHLVGYLTQLPTSAEELIGLLNEKSLKIAKKNYRRRFGEEFDTERKHNSEKFSHQSTRRATYQSLLESCTSFGDRVRIFSSLRSHDLKVKLSLRTEEYRRLVDMRNGVAHGHDIIDDGFNFQDLNLLIQRCLELDETLGRYLSAFPGLDPGDMVPLKLLE